MDVAAWMRRTTAEDSATRNVVALKAKQPPAEAIHQLLEADDTGAPVVADGGACVGVLSIGYLARAEEIAAEDRANLARSEFLQSPLALPTIVHAERLDAIRDRLVPLGQQPVERAMTSDVVSVRRETPLSVVIQSMVDAHVHRVVVTGADGVLVGIVSTTDVLAALLSIARRAEIEEEAS